MKSEGNRKKSVDEVVNKDLQQDPGAKCRYEEQTLSMASRNTQSLASAVDSPTQVSDLAVNKIPRNGLGDNTLG